MGKNSNFKQYLAIAIVALCLIGINSAIAVPNLSIPANAGIVKDKYINNSSDLLIIHIQDLHCNYDAQISIYKIVDKLIKEQNLKLVTVEGSVGQLETTPFCNYPEEDIKETVAKEYMKAGTIDGAGLAHIMSKGAFSFWGIDDAVLYKENTEAYKGSLASRSSNNAFCDNIKSILDKFKQKIYNKNLLNFDKQAQSYKEDKVPFTEFASYLNELINEYKIEKTSFSNFNKLAEVLALERQIDFTLADTQRSECIEKLSKKLEKDALSKLLNMSLHFKTGGISTVEFYSYLKEVIDKNRKVASKDYPELDKYISYILSYNSIEHIGLFEEISQIEDALKEKMFSRDIERQLNSLSKNIEILKNLANLKLITQTLDYYRKDRSAFLVSNFINFINENAPKYKITYIIDPNFRNIDGQLPDLEKFYTLALERDKILVDNTIDKMNQLNTKTAVLVAGGFHTQGISEFLKAKGISYIVVTPKVNELDEKNNPYVSLIIGKRTPFEELLYKQAVKNNQKYPEAFVFQNGAKCLADIHKTIRDLNKK